MRRPQPLPDFDCYAELGVEPWAGAETIERAWRDAMRVSHPDAAGGTDAVAATLRAARLNIAREWLLDARRRAEYDAIRWPRHARPAPEIDPLGAWPARQPRPRPPASIAPALALLATMGLLAALVLGPGPNNLGAAALAVLCLVLIGFYSGITLLRVVGRR
ncbi:MAG TPA: DnaJ domain-containing protein [Candidatus Limnocylindrales bacterium]|nr:DnaJ domain-containing protein [Candidatus Limnocylindrales bacterium]